MLWVPLPDDFPGCVLTGSNQWFAALWAAPLVTDSCVFLLTLWRTIRYRTMHMHMPTTQVIFRDGIIYFTVIFGANLMNTLIYFVGIYGAGYASLTYLAVEDVKAVGASQILTAIMVARLQLNLRRAATQTDSAWEYAVGVLNDQSVPFHARNRNDDSLGTSSSFFAIGNLGEDLQETFFEGALHGYNDDQNDENILELDELSRSVPLMNPNRRLADPRPPRPA
ncbi:hypothetical protein D9757_005109 [Collybiopsis confluens]|uniref:Uncharacterized protein n=1 Tax=Collybiopsis confluens TaxID=2823264 RepID=A0A8H5HT52_9AGAR|nr:hypothetical protein D9757_005109 [Collybiopsis confluens]